MAKPKTVDSTGKKYPAQFFTGRKFEYCNVFPADKALKVTVNYIYFPYPFGLTVYVKDCKTWGELFKKIFTHFKRLYWKDRREKGEDTVAWHYLGDYIVESVEIFDDGTAVTYVGS